jgi:hypothetical protein
MNIKNTKNLLFSSVGNNTSFDTLYNGNNMNYDIYVIYYGDNNILYNRYKRKVNFIEKRKGSKFQNFKYFYEKYPEIINDYEYFFILDDDIIINVKDINNMFKLARDYNLSICGPSFSPIGKISHSITKNKSNILLTYTNFVEVNTPLYNKKALDNLMKVLDSTLIGWGIDYLSILCNGIDRSDAYAIVHSIKCINPHENNKKNKTRELNLISNFNIRSKIWFDYSKKIGYPPSFKMIEYNSIPLI